MKIYNRQALNLYKNYSVFKVQKYRDTNNNSLLLKLRRETGFPVKKCRDALLIHEDDYEKAKIYLDESAIKENWDKAQRLQHKFASNGLIGTIVSHKHKYGIITELSCETDFVSKNHKFSHIFDSILHIIDANHLANNDKFDKEIITNTLYDIDKINQYNVKDKKIINLINSGVGSFGENIHLKRVLGLNVNKTSEFATSIFIGSYCHNIHSHNADRNYDASQISIGKYGALIAVKLIRYKDDNTNEKNINKLCDQLAQHIVGMNPSCIGTESHQIRQNNNSSDSCKDPKSFNSSEPLDLNAVPENRNINSPEGEDEYCDEFSPQFYEEYYKNLKKEEALASENRFIKQQFLADPDVKVEEVLKDNSLEILDFVRFECGEQLN